MLEVFRIFKYMFFEIYNTLLKIEQFSNKTVYIFYTEQYIVPIYHIYVYYNGILSMQPIWLADIFGTHNYYLLIIKQNNDVIIWTEQNSSFLSILIMKENNYMDMDVIIWTWQKAILLTNLHTL